MDVCNNPGQQDQFIREMRSRTLDEYEQRLLSLKEQHSSHKRKLDDIQNRDVCTLVTVIAAQRSIDQIVDIR